MKITYFIINSINVFTIVNEEKQSGVNKQIPACFGRLHLQRPDADVEFNTNHLKISVYGTSLF
jgi:hypothetical protein